MNVKNGANVSDEEISRSDESGSDAEGEQNGGRADHSAGVQVDSTTDDNERPGHRLFPLPS